MRKAQEKEGEGLVEQDRERGESEEGGWKRWRGGEVNAPRGNATHAARQAIRGPMSESTFYRALRSFSFSLPLLPDSRRGCYTHTSVCGHVDVIFSARSNLSIRERLYAVRRQHDAAPRNDP